MGRFRRETKSRQRGNMRVIVPSAGDSDRQQAGSSERVFRRCGLRRELIHFALMKIVALPVKRTESYGQRRHMSVSKCPGGEIRW